MHDLQTQNVNLDNVRFLFFKVNDFLKDKLKNTQSLLKRPSQTAQSQKLSVPPINDFDFFSNCSDESIIRDRTWHKKIYYLINDYYKLFQKKILPYSIFSYLLNCVINNQNHEMSAKEISHPLNELQHKLNKNEVYETDKTKYYLRLEELKFFITIIIELQKLSEPETDFSTTCSDESVLRDRTWYTNNFSLILHCYKVFKKNIIPSNYVYSVILYLINCVINYQNWEMSAKEISDTLIELQRRINNNEVFETDYKKYDLNSNELKYLINILTDLNTYDKQQKLQSQSSQRPTIQQQTPPTVIQEETSSQLTESRFTLDFMFNCGLSVVKRDREWYERNYNLIKRYYELLEQNMYPFNFIYPKISALLNCVINSQLVNREMTTDEISKTLSKLLNRIKKNKMYNSDPNAKKSLFKKYINTKQYYLTVEELQYFITILIQLQIILRRLTETRSTSSSLNESLDTTPVIPTSVQEETNETTPTPITESIETTPIIPTTITETTETTPTPIIPVTETTTLSDLPQRPSVPTECNDESRKWYLNSFYLIKDYYRILQKNVVPFDYIYNKISSLLNCVINKQNRKMNAEDFRNGLVEIHRRIKDNESYDSKPKKFYLRIRELNFLITVLTDLQTSLRKSTESMNDYKTTCIDTSLDDRDRIWYIDNYYIITFYYDIIKRNILPFDDIYPNISYLLNCVINKQNQKMNTKDLSNTLIELQRRIDNHEYYNENSNNTKNKQHYIKAIELNNLITIIKDLQTYIKQKKSKTEQTSETNDDNSSVVVAYGRHNRRNKTKQTSTVSDDDSTVVMVGYGCRHLRRRHHRNHFFLS